MRVADLINKLSIEEKVSLCSGNGPWSTKKIEKLAIPEVYMSDGPAGPRWMKNISEAKKWDMSSLASFNSTSGYTDLLHPVTNFPSLSTLCSSWDRDLISQVGKAIGEECQHLGIGVLLAPGVNIIRHPLCGRAYEYFSEDPVLAGELGAAYIEGVQSSGVGATVKHFACNNAEFERLSMDSVVEERALREIYLAVFERIVKKAKPALVMESYNKVNGVSLAENKHLLSEVLKTEWGFEGVVISDWWAINDKVASFNAGLDLEMPQQLKNDEALLMAVKSGKVSIDRLNDACNRILSLALKYGRQEKKIVDLNSHHALAKKAARESIVLLKNNQDILPIDPKSGTIAVIGSFAKEPRYQGWGCSIVNPRRLLNPLEEIKAIAKNVLYSDGYLEGDKMSEELIQEAKSTATNADTVILFVGLPEAYETETHDRVDYNLPEAHLILINSLSEVSDRIVVVLQNGSAIAVKPWIDKVQAIFEAYLGGEAGAGAIADLLFGVDSPSGKLAVTFPNNIEDAPGYLNFPGENNKHVYQEGLFVGYRYYEKKLIEPTFPFGFGLSYTKFLYSDLKLSSNCIEDNEQLTVSFNITNIGKRRGAEVAQIYIKPSLSRLKRPLKELKGFVKLDLNPGETKKAVLELSGRDFAYYDDFLRTWVVESGVYTIVIGSSSLTIHLEDKLEMRSRQVNFIPITGESYCYNLFDNTFLLNAFKKVMIENGIWPSEIDDDYLQAIKQNFIPLFKSIERQTEGKITRDVFDQWLIRINDEAKRLSEASVKMRVVN
jgi:beta-glucosidase